MTLGEMVNFQKDKLPAKCQLAKNINHSHSGHFMYKLAFRRLTISDSNMNSKINR